MANAVTRKILDVVHVALTVLLRCVISSLRGEALGQDTSDAYP